MRGDVAGEEETQLGVPLIRDRAPARSSPARWSGGRSGAFDTRRLTLHGAAAIAGTVLVAAAVTGAVPFPAAAAVAFLVPAAVVDVEQRRLPDVWVASSLIVLLGALAIQSAVGPPTDGASTISGAFGGALTMALPVLTLHLVSPASMGFGDVKAAAALGAAVGTIDWRLSAVALCVAALAGAVFGLAARRRTIAFGPFLVFGAWLTLMAHDSIGETLFTATIAVTSTVTSTGTSFCTSLGGVGP